MTIASKRAALATALDTIPHLNVSPYVTTVINPPQAMIDYTINYNTDMAPDGHTFLWTIRVFVLATSERASGATLDDLRDAESHTSVPYVLEHDSGIGAAFDSVDVRDVSDITVYETGGAAYLSVDFTVQSL